MTPRCLLALSELRLGLSLAKQGLEHVGDDAALDAKRCAELDRLHHTIADWRAFVEALLAEVAP